MTTNSLIRWKCGGVVAYFVQMVAGSNPALADLWQVLQLPVAPRRDTVSVLCRERL